MIKTFKYGDKQLFPLSEQFLHCGIKENEESDSAAKEALFAHLEICGVPSMDLKPIICSYVNNMTNRVGSIYNE